MNIFLLRGLVREKGHWGNFLLKAKNAFPDANIICPEIPGVGEFHKITSPDNLEGLVDFMRANYKDVIEKSDQNVLFALSLGGMIAKCWMEKYPNDFKHVILGNTSYRGLSPMFKRLQPKALFKFAHLFLTINTPLRELGILRLVSNSPNEKLLKILPYWIEIQKKRPVKRKSFINQIKAALTFHPKLSKPKANLLILAGAGDKLCSSQCSLDAYKAWGGKLEIHPSAGHDLPIDAPEWTLDQIKSWLNTKELH